MTSNLEFAALLAGPILAMVLFSRQCRYYFKYIVIYGGISLMSTFLVPILAFRPFNVLNLLLAAALYKNVSKLVGLRWKLRGSQHLAEQKAYVIVANHQTDLDILGMFEIWAVMRKCTVVAKTALFYAWPMGLAAWLCGLIFIDRVKAGSARDSMNKAADIIKKGNIKLWIFPEGTRKNTGEIHPFKKGAFHVAVNAQVPILPVVFSPYYFLDDSKRTLDSGEIIISALPPIPTEGLTVDDVDSLMQKVRENMMQEYTKMSNEVKSDLLAPRHNAALLKAQ